MSNFTRSAKRSADTSCCLGLLLIAAASPACADSLGFEQDAGDVPVVIAATRLQQSLFDTPASVTVIDRALIRASGARELPDIMRLVPGMVVGRESASEAYVSYHGTAGFGSRRMQVQVDGRSIYQAGLALVDWIGLPLDVEDIERIEVVRGPDSAAYGANSFLGVINIITRHPQDVPNAEVMVRGGENGVADAFGRLSLHGLGADWSWTAFHREDNGYDTNLKRKKPYMDDMAVTGAYGKGIWYTPRDGQLMLSVGGSSMEAQQERFNDTSIYRSLPVVSATGGYIMFDWDQPWADKHRLQLQVSHDRQHHEEPWYVRIPYLAVSPEMGDFWRNDRQTADDFLDDPEATCTGSQVATNQRLRNLCLKAILDPDYLAEHDYTTDQNFDEQRSVIEVSDTWVPHPRLRLVGGIQGMYSEVTSRTFLNGTASNTVLSAFGHGELRLGQNWLLNLGGDFEDDEHAGQFFLPRAALSWQFQPNQVLRLVQSRAVRTPDIFENQADWHYYATTSDVDPDGVKDLNGPFYMSAKSDGTARSERIRSNEVSYFGNFQRFSLDVRLFRDELDLVSNRLEINRFLLSGYQHYLMRGGEVGSEWRITPFQRLLVNYARLSISSPDTVKSDNMDLVPRHSGSLTWARLDPDGWRASATYGFYKNLNRELFFDRLDLHMGRVLPVGQRQQLDLGVTAQLRLSDDPELRTSNGLDNRHKIWASAAWRY